MVDDYFCGEALIDTRLINHHVNLIRFLDQRVEIFKRTVPLLEWLNNKQLMKGIDDMACDYSAPSIDTPI